MPIPGLPSEPEQIASDLVLPGVVSTNVRDTPFKVCWVSVRGRVRHRDRVR